MTRIDGLPELHCVSQCSDVRLSCAKCVTRFWLQVERRSASECWPWRGTLHENGYGTVRFAGAFRRSHVVSLELCTPPTRKPAGAEVLHQCDNPPCCNPAHLRWGTRAENLADQIERGRYGSGKRLTENQIADIRCSPSSESTRSIARRLGLSRDTIERHRGRNAQD